ALGEWEWVVRPPAPRLREFVLGYHGLRRAGGELRTAHRGAVAGRAADHQLRPCLSRLRPWWLRADGYAGELRRGLVQRLCAGRGERPDERSAGELYAAGGAAILWPAAGRDGRPQRRPGRPAWRSEPAGRAARRAAELVRPLRSARRADHSAPGRSAAAAAARCARLAAAVRNERPHRRRRAGGRAGL